MVFLNKVGVPRNFQRLPARKYRALPGDTCSKPRATMEARSQTPLFTFGVIADIQYADIDDGFNYTRTRTRYYRSSLQLLRRAWESWTAEAATAAAKPRFVLQLGDLIDGYNKRDDRSDRALDTVMREFAAGPVRVHHVWGNHEFYNFTRDKLLRSELNSMSGCDGGTGRGPRTADIYAYHFSPAAHFRVVVLDAYDVSLLGRVEASARYAEALRLLMEHNSNDELNEPPASEGVEQRFVKFNGGFSKDQLDWLDQVLTLTDENGERVTIVSHLPVHPGSTDPVCLAWNYEEVLALIRAHRSVVCFIAGHDHDGGYHRDAASGVHHLTLEGVVETPPDSDAFGTVCVFEDRMLLKGHGRVGDRELLFP